MLSNQEIKVKINRILTKEFLEKEVNVYRKTRQQISDETQISLSSIQNRLSKFGIRQHKSFVDLTNKRFGKLLVLEKTDKRKCKNIVWKCKCDCSNIIEVIGGNLIGGSSKSCGCTRRGKGNKSVAWKGYGNLSGRYFCTVKTNAKKRGLKFDITIKYAWELFLQQKEKCALTNWNITLKQCGNQTASLDRISSLGDYVEGNIQWVHKDVNIMKMDYTQEEFVNMCKAVTKNFEKKKFTMAKVEIIKETVVLEKGVVLTLSIKEAIVLHSLLRQVGGDPITSLRMYVDNMLDALCDKVNYLELDYLMEPRGKLWFKSNTLDKV